MSNAGNTHFFQLFVLERNERFSLDSMVWRQSAPFSPPQCQISLTNKGLAVLPQVQSRHKLCAVFRSPFGYDRPR